MKQIIFIEGSIGTGKSQTIEQLKSISNNVFPHLKVAFIPEPIGVWERFKDEAGQSILQLFYQQQRQYSLKLQLVLLKSLMDQFKQIEDDCDIIIVERSPDSQRQIFVQQFINTQKMDVLDLQIYEAFRDDLWNPIKQHIEKQQYRFKFVYIKSSVSKCMERIKRRNRQAEQSIPKEYIQQLETLHDSWMRNIEHFEINNEVDQPLNLEILQQMLEF